jgi:hypothetical protein
VRSSTFSSYYGSPGPRLRLRSDAVTSLGAGGATVAERPSGAIGGDFHVTNTEGVQAVHSEQDLYNALGQTTGLVVLEVDPSLDQTSGSSSEYQLLARDYDKVTFLKIAGNENASTQKVVTEVFNAKSTPSFYFIRNGEVVGEQAGGNLGELQSTLNRNFLSVDLMGSV